MMSDQTIGARLIRAGAGYVLAVLLGGGVLWAAIRLSPPVRGLVWSEPGDDVEAAADEGHDDAEHAHHAEEEHAHDEHDEHDDGESVTLSAQARRNIGLETTKIQRSAFQRAIRIPAVVVDHAGLTEVDVAAPMTGIITRFHVLEGEAVEPGEPLFELRLTHEELVQAQSELLRTAEELDVVEREIARLEDVVAGGAVAGRRVLEQQYERQKLQAALKAHRESLVLHGLTREQVGQILEKRELLGEFTIFAPHSPADRHRETMEAEDPATDDAGGKPRLLYVNRLLAGVGQHVTVGDPVFRLSDHTVLFIEGKAFERDAAAIRTALAKEWPVDAEFEAADGEASTVSGLEVMYVSNVVEMDTRALHVYVRLPNRILEDTVRGEGHRYVVWQYRPGQRLKLRIPIEEWVDEIILPAEAVAQDGAENFVFKADGDHFDRQAVQIAYRDQFTVVIASDGSLAEGEIVAKTGAHELLLALKAKLGGGGGHHGHHH